MPMSTGWTPSRIKQGLYICVIMGIFVLNVLWKKSVECDSTHISAVIPEIAKLTSVSHPFSFY